MFQDRRQAARLLAARLMPLRREDPLVLAVPRGAVPMGEVIAELLEGELDVALVHKIGAPGNPEYAIGAIDERGELLLRADAGGVDPARLAREAERQLAELRRRRALFTPGRAALPVAGRTVVVVDDGVATGATLQAALQLVRAGGPRRLVAAVGVAPPEVVRRLARYADEVVCLEQPIAMLAVGEAFADFRQVEDAEVVSILRRAAGRREAQRAGSTRAPSSSRSGG